jgi:hypothetical protein
MRRIQTLFVITYESGQVIEEYGDDVVEVLEFCKKLYSHYGPVRSVVPHS